MLRCTPTCLGRWTSRDFLRGRSKRAGAVHTRHTHGRQGRYKRLSSLYSSIRDGRRHASNHMQGGLGIKIGGGLFGLRIPRQHKLSHMSKEDFDLEVYGHPNITNPYREHLDEHPDLKSVMMNASVAVRMVVLMPRVARNGGSARSGSNYAPAKWRRVAGEVNNALESLMQPPPPAETAHAASSLREAAGPSVEVHFATLETSVCCQWTPHGELSSPCDGASCSTAQLEAGVAQLYRAHSRLGQTLKLEKTDTGVASPSVASRPQHSHAPLPSSTPHRRRPATFMGAALKAPSMKGTVKGGIAAASTLPLVGAAPSPASAKSFTSSVLAQLIKEASSASTQSSSLGLNCSALADASAVPSGDGVAGVVHRLSTTEQPLLRVCLRPSSTGPDTARSAPPVASAPPTPRRVLRADIDANAEVGVWGLPASPLYELLRWHYCAQDPRAHNHDALPHHRRSLPVLFVVDYSTADIERDARPAAGLATQRGVLHTTLMPRRLSLELESAGFRMVKETSLQSAAEAIARWSPSAQWDRLAQPDVTSVPPTEEHRHAKPCVSC